MGTLTDRRGSCHLVTVGAGVIDPAPSRDAGRLQEQVPDLGTRSSGVAGLIDSRLPVQPGDASWSFYPNAAAPPGPAFTCGASLFLSLGEHKERPPARRQGSHQEGKEFRVGAASLATPTAPDRTICSNVAIPAPCSRAERYPGGGKTRAAIRAFHHRARGRLGDAIVVGLFHEAPSRMNTGQTQRGPQPARLVRHMPVALRIDSSKG